MSFEPVFIFAFSLALIALFIKCADRCGFVDTPDSRSSHFKITPSGSGIAIFIVVFIAPFFTDLNIYHSYNMTKFAVIMVLLLGVFDDLKNYPARYKLYVITVAAVLSVIDGFVITNIGSYFNYSVPLFWMSIPFTVFAIIGFTNAFNLIDGLDGLAGIIGIIIFASLFFIGYQYEDSLLTGTSAIIIPALLAFLFYNWNPARVFMGDSGSLTLGFVISILSIKALDYVNPVVVLYILALPLIDTLAIMTRRRKHGRSIFAPDKNHAHHILLNYLNGNVRLTVILLALIQLAYTLAGLLLVNNLPQEITLPFFLINIACWYLVLTWLCEKHPVVAKKHDLKLDHEHTG